MVTIVNGKYFLSVVVNISNGHTYTYSIEGLRKRQFQNYDQNSSPNV